MAEFNKLSQQRLEGCHPDLQVLFNEVVLHFDCTVLVGPRGQEEQDKAFNEGKSKLKYPNGMHNKTPSLAVDVAPYPIDWKDKDRFYFFSGFVMAIAAYLKIGGAISHGIRWGGDWDGDKDLHDQTLYDLVHFEILENEA